MKTLILGGVRSGKSRYAETLAIQSAKKSHGKLLYIATSFPQDAEMQLRVDEHQAQREQSVGAWITVEETVYLSKQLKKQADTNTTILVDCLTLWMSNLLCHEDKALLDSETQKVLDLLPTLEGNVFFVSNETGLGVVPMNQLSRQFVEKMGLFHQRLAGLCNQACFVVAGLPITMKDSK